MKKLLIICIFVLIPLSVFAAFEVTVRGGGMFDFTTGKTSIDAKYSDKLSGVDFSASGVGFEVGMDMVMSKDLQMYIDFALAFPSKVNINGAVSRTDVEKSLENTKKTKNPEYKFHSSDLFFNTLSAHIGFAHKFDLLAGPLELTLGAGFGIFRINEGYRMIKFKIEGENHTPYYYADYTTVTTFSAGLYANAQYSLSTRLSAVCTLMPDLGFYTIARRINYNAKSSDDYTKLEPTELVESTGFSFSFNMKAFIGLSFIF